MSFCQHRFKSIDLIQCKYIRLNLIDALQHIHKPSTSLKPFCIQPVCRPHLMQYSIPANFHAILYYCNSSLYRNFIKQNITSYPAGTFGIGAKRLSLFHNPRHKKVFGYNPEMSNAQRIRVIAQYKKIRIAVTGNPLNESFIGPVGNFMSRQTAFAFQFIFIAALWAVKICHGLIIWTMIQFRMAASRTVHMCLYPGFCQNPNAL